MKRRTHVITAVLLASGVVASSDAFAGSAPTVDPAMAATASARAVVAPQDDHRGRDFERFLERFEAANSAFLNGDPALWRAITTEKDPASIFGGFGGLGDIGVTAVNQRYVLAANAFQPSGAEVDIEYFVKDVRGKLAYTVAIERADVLYAGQTEVRPQELRVTMVFRYERGDWKIIHRHADTMVALELPS